MIGFIHFIGLYSRFFGFEDSTENAVSLARIMIGISPIIAFTIVMSSTFQMIFIADQLGGGPGIFLQGLALVGVLVVIRMIVQTPTIAILIAIPQITVFGAAIQYVGFPITLVLTAMIPPAGVLMIQKGLSFPIPIVEERKLTKTQESLES
ncbi:MAG: hypothetical protein EAX95_05550 [Candidatus Thorarchaeota archaeon]|nr:hypothetical protein [Candidatus Thorarchaeota archaeon]